jgi:hypothetical protein
VGLRREREERYERERKERGERELVRERARKRMIEIER